jgi:UDP-N-acetylglucosamine 1-carboxyvinyltransferase
MDKFIIDGGKTLAGDVFVSGSKNAALPVLCSSILSGSLCRYRNIPQLMDIKTMLEVLGVLGVKWERHETGIVEIDPSNISCFAAPYDLVKSMRASILVLGPLLARFGQAKVSLPGGCAIGVRPIDLHLKAMAKMGAEIELKHGYVYAKAKKLKGAHIIFSHTTVGGTENVLMAACLAEGTTIIEGAAMEPEITDLADALSAMGAQIEGAGQSTITIHGVKELGGLDHNVIPDRIEVGTLMAAAAITKGKLRINNARCGHVEAVSEKLDEMGVKISRDGPEVIEVDGNVDLRPVDVSTAPFPGFPTDMQAQIMTLACIAGGVSSITENIFENRFMHVPELIRMGASLEERSNTVIIHGIKRFEGANVMATDLRASASLVLAGLNARGYTEIRRIYHLDRGYDGLDKKLNTAGASIRREKGGL